MNEKISLAIFNKLCKDTNLYVIDHYAGVMCGYAEPTPNARFIMVEYCHGDIYVSTKIYADDIPDRCGFCEKELVFVRNEITLKQYNKIVNHIRELTLNWKKLKIIHKKDQLNMDFI